jgi:hypothetical protein
MSGARGISNMRAAVRMRHADAGVVSEMARSLHRDARSERERAGERVRSGTTVRAQEIVCAIEATHRVRPPRVRTTRPRRVAPALIA